MEQVRKIDMAIQQLEDALTTYYLGRYHSALVLAGAAEELFGVYVRKHGGTPAWGQTRAAITKISNGLRERQGDEEPASEDEIGRQMNYAYNNSKHAGPADLEIQFDPKTEAQDRIDRTICNFDVLRSLPDYQLPDLPLAQRFIMESIGRVVD